MMGDAGSRQPCPPVTGQSVLVAQTTWYHQIAVALHDKQDRQADEIGKTRQRWMSPDVAGDCYVLHLLTLLVARHRSKVAAVGS
jgi:hypothetical protein